jgi:hypothetical protein
VTRALHTLGAIIALWAVALAGALASACDGAPRDDSDAEIEAGTAGPDGWGYVPGVDGTDVSLVPGAQSGFHVWLNVRVRGIAGELALERTARRQRDGVLVFRGLPQLIEIPAAARDDWWESPVAAPAFMCPSPIGIQVFDEALVFEVRLLSDRGDDASVLAEDTLVLIPHCPSGGQAAFCADICAG